jgi:predicted GNAT family N-acyltransferase
MRNDFFIVDTLTEEQLIQLFDMYKNERWSKERKLDDVRIMLENSNIIALINRNNNELISFARFLSDSIYRATIYDVMVSEKYRGLGYGRVLLETVISHNQLRNIERVELYCPNQKVSFYEKFGFKKVPEETNFMRRTPL